MTPRVPPFKVTQGHRNRHGSIRHLWLAINSNHGPISYWFSDKRRFRSNVGNFPTPVYLTPPMKGALNWAMPNYLELGIGSLVRKLEWWGYLAEKEVWRYLQPFGYNTRTWRTRQTDTRRQQIPQYAWRCAV